MHEVHRRPRGQARCRALYPSPKHQTSVTKQHAAVCPKPTGPGGAQAISRAPMCGAHHRGQLRQARLESCPTAPWPGSPARPKEAMAARDPPRPKTPTLQVSPLVRSWPSQGTRNKAPAGEGAADAWLPVRAARLAGPRPLQPRFAPVSVRTAWTAGLTESSPGHDPHSEVTCFSQEHTGPPTFPEGSLRARPTRTFSAAP